MRWGTVALVAVWAVIICAWIYTGVSWHNCNESGGEYVRSMTGIYKCVHTIEQEK